MPVLSNPKHERFAQELAGGKSSLDAYVTAGYSPNRSAASRLQTNVNICERVSELLAERDAMAQQATAKAAEALSIDKQWVLARLVENAERALQAVEIKDSRGVGTGEYKYEGSVANRALELIGKEFGMFIDRKEVRKGSLDGLNADDRKELREAIERELASRSGGTEARGKLQ